MFTSRAEFRLHLRIDNADERLTPLGRRAGLVNDERWSRFQRRRRQKELIRQLLETNRTFPELGLAADDRPFLSEWLRRPDAKVNSLSAFLTNGLSEPADPTAMLTVETEIKYAGYIDQQIRQMSRLRESANRKIPADFVFESIPGLSREVSERLKRVRPATLGQAGRIPGVTPAALAILDIYLRVGPADVQAHAVR
jgi:tRNA uridine 5-carboxymethylaminomethyl modification enzyme